MDRLHHMLAVDWASVFLPAQPLLEIVVRGTLSYIALFLIMRFAMKRQTGAIGIADLLVIVIIADASQNAMAGEAKSLSEGLLLVLTIVFWDSVIDWLSYRIPALKNLTNPPPSLLILEGRPLPRHLAAEKMTMDELMSLLRAQGVKDIGEVERAYIEGDGRLSVLRRGTQDPASAGGDQSTRRTIG